MIDGARVVPLARIPDERGTILHMLRATDPHFIAFGEIYFSTVYRDVVKGWHRHREMTLSYACPFGRVKLVLYDERDGSPTFGELDRGVPRPRRLRAGPGPARRVERVQGHERPPRRRGQLRTHPHDPSRSERIDPFDNQIPYDWAVRHA